MIAIINNDKVKQFILQVVNYKEHQDRISAGPDTPLVQMFRDRHDTRFEANPDSGSSTHDAWKATIFLRPEFIIRMEDRFVDIEILYGPNYGRSMGYDKRGRRDLSNPENFPAGTQRASILFEID